MNRLQVQRAMAAWPAGAPADRPPARPAPEQFIRRRMRVSERAPPASLRNDVALLRRVMTVQSERAETAGKKHGGPKM